MKLRKQYQSLVLLFGLFLLTTGSALAQIPEPGNLVYGTVSVDGTQLTAVNRNFSIQLEYNGEILSSYTLGDNPSLADRYLLEVPLDTGLARNPNALRIGDGFVIRYQADGISFKVADVVVVERGATIELNLALLSEDLPTGIDSNAIDSDGDGISDIVEVAAGLNPLSADDAGLDSDGDGINNLQEFLNGTDISIDDNPPQLIASSDKTYAATALFSKVDLGHATAFDAKDGILTATPDGNGFYAPGVHLITWRVADAAGNTATATQTIKVNPLVNFHRDMLVAEGNNLTLKVELNGTAARYPVTVPYSVSGTATGEGVDHTLADGDIVIEAGFVGSVEFMVLDDGQDGEDVESIVVTMGTPVNAVMGRKNEFVVSISEQNIAPQVSLSATQGGLPTLLVVTGNGVVTVAATVVDPNSADSHDFDWSLGDNTLVDIDGDAFDASFEIDPVSLMVGIYKLSLMVTDSSGATMNTDLLLSVVNEAPVLSADNDSDGDGLNDLDEGFTDSDGDGIPNYLDGISQPNLLTAMQPLNQSYLLETEIGLQLRLGRVGLSAGSGNAMVSLAEVDAVYGAVTSTSNGFTGGLFDFWISGLDSPGDSVNIVLPQLEAIAVNSNYAKLTAPFLNWNQFIENENNALFSATGAQGYCPPPGDEAYTPGLTDGNWCVMLLLEDGGPNDSDGLANQLIKDPGGVDNSVQVEVTSSGGGGGGGSLSLSWLVALLTLSLFKFRSLRHLSGLLIVVFSLSAQTQQSTGTTSLERFLNSSPLAQNDTAQIEKNQALDLYVLNNDRDSDGDGLIIVAAQTDQGRVEIRDKTRLWYKPPEGFTGSVRIQYSIYDGRGMISPSLASAAAIQLPSDDESCDASIINCNGKPEDTLSLRLKINFDNDRAIVSEEYYPVRRHPHKYFRWGDIG